MTTGSSLQPTAGRRLAASALVSALFLAAINTPLLYFQNQNTKFLHGLATAFPDRLGSDWTAGTVDGLPVFTALVHAIAAWSHPALFYAIEAAFLTVMCLSLVAIARLVAPTQGARLLFTLIVGGLLAVLVHPPQEDTLRGVAQQYMTRGYFQPSEFGILYLPALLLAVRRHPAALLLAAIPAAMHPAYIAFSAIAVVLFALDRWRAGEPLALMALVPSVALIALPALDLARRFAPTDPETFVQANAILAFERIPHHSDPMRWADWAALRKLVIAVLALAVAPAGVVRWMLAALLMLAAGGAAFVALTGNPEVALMAPWRASIIIVPVSTAILLGWLLEKVPDRPRLWPALAVVVTLWAVWAAIDGLAEKRRDIVLSALPDYAAFVRENHAPSDVYLTDPDMFEFRLQAMTAQFVTWKTHPYLDTEVIEWNKRARMAARVYRKKGLDCAALENLLAVYPVSHVLARTSGSGRPACDGLEEAFRGKKFTVYQVAGTQ